MDGVVDMDAVVPPSVAELGVPSVHVERVVLPAVDDRVTDGEVVVLLAGVVGVVAGVFVVYLRHYDRLLALAADEVQAEQQDQRGSDALH